MLPNEVYTCGWPTCLNNAITQIWDVSGLKYIRVCSQHRTSVLVSLEHYNTLCPEEAAIKAEQGHVAPKAQAATRQTPKEEIDPDREHKKKILRKAEDAAIPIDDWLQKKRKSFHEPIRPPGG